MPVHDSPNLIYAAGTQVVILKEVLRQNGKIAHPKEAVGVVVHSPSDRDHTYRVRFNDGFEATFYHAELRLLAEYKEGTIYQPDDFLASEGLYDRVIFRCVIGSRAYGLDDSQSDIDRRGVYLPPANLHWSLAGVPEQLENDATQEVYWELQKFIVLALKANPNVLECLYSPMVEVMTPIAKELLDIRSCFLSKLLYQTYNGYVMSQFKKMQSDLRNQGKLKWKHVMHLIRILQSGITAMREQVVSVNVGDQREQLLAIKRGEVAWEEIDLWRIKLHQEFDEAFANTDLPDRPDYERAGALLIKARRLAVEQELP